MARLIAPPTFSLGLFYTQAGSKYKDFEEKIFAEGQQRPALVTGHAFTNQHHTFGYITVPIMAHYYVAQGFFDDKGPDKARGSCD